MDYPSSTRNLGSPSDLPGDWALILTKRESSLAMPHEQWIIRAIQLLNVSMGPLVMSASFAKGNLHRYADLHRVMAGKAQGDAKFRAFFEVILAKGFGPKAVILLVKQDGARAKSSTRKGILTESVPSPAQEARAAKVRSTGIDSIKTQSPKFDRTGLIIRDWP